MTDSHWPAGWYPADAVYRWWDGEQWTEATRRASDWRMRFLAWSRTTLLCRTVAAWSALGAVLGAVIVVVGFASGAAVPGADWLIVPAVPAVVIGQGVAVAVVAARSLDGREVRRFGVRKVGLCSFLGMAFGSARRAVAVTVLSFLLVAAAIASVWTGPAGVPFRDRAGCTYGLDDHGTTHCVSKDEYDDATSRTQRFVASILAAAFVNHAGMVTAELARRRMRDVER